MATYDLTAEIGQFLDPHLMLKVIEFIDEQKVYVDPKNPMMTAPEVVTAKLDLLNKTNMVDYALDIFKNQHPDQPEPKEMKTRRDEVVKSMKSLEKECSPLLELFKDQTLVKQLRVEKLFTAAYLQEAHKVEPEVVESLFKYGKVKFECGKYEEAAELLSYYKLLGTDQERLFSSLWGKLASEILMLNWDVAFEDLTRLREAIEARNSQPLEQLQNRSWLVHWSLFVFFLHPNTERGRNGIVDLLFNERYLCAVQTNCPHVLRYLTAAVICNKRRRSMLKDLVKVIQQERYTYTDPVTRFIECLYVDFDFEQAQKQLGECEKVLATDYFLKSMQEEFLENARVFVFETYCRIHQKIDIGMLAEKLHMDNAEDAERWIVNLIRNASLDAKIDSKANHVVMGTNHPSVYQSVIEATENLSFRSYVLANALAQRLTAAGYGTQKMMSGGYETASKDA
jgi:translation initiation factor 3 subunit E